MIILHIRIQTKPLLLLTGIRLNTFYFHFNFESFVYLIIAVCYLSFQEKEKKYIADLKSELLFFIGISNIYLQVISLYYRTASRVCLQKKKIN